MADSSYDHTPSPKTQILLVLLKKRLFAFYLDINVSKQSIALCDTRARVSGNPIPPTTAKKNEFDLTLHSYS